MFLRHLCGAPNAKSIAALLLIHAVMLCGSAFAQGYPNKPIHILIGFSAGSTTDVLARSLGQKISESWGQQLVVDNRPSAGGIVAATSVATAAPDGYTLLMVSAGHAVTAAMFPKLPYDTLKDFAGVSQVANVPAILVVPPSLGAKSVKDLVAIAKARPGQLNFSSAGVGSAAHLAGELFKKLAGIQAVHVPYKGIPEAVTAIVTDSVQFTFSGIFSALPLVRNGKVIALAASTGRRSSVLPDLPTVAEAGVSGYVFDPWFGILAPAGTPREVLDKLNREIRRVLELPDVKERLLSLGAEPEPTSPEGFDAIIRAEVAKYRQIVREAGIKAD